MRQSVREENAQRLTEGSYQRAYIDFFEDQLVEHGYDWKALLEKYLYEGDEPLINNMVSGRTPPEEENRLYDCDTKYLQWAILSSTLDTLSN